MQLSKDYIIGLVDGEGSFTAFVRNLDQSTERVRRTRIEPRFYIKLIEKDKPILDALRDYFGCGLDVVVSTFKKIRVKIIKIVIVSKYSIEKNLKKSSFHFSGRIHCDSPQNEMTSKFSVN